MPDSVWTAANLGELAYKQDSMLKYSAKNVDKKLSESDAHPVLLN